MINVWDWQFCLKIIITAHGQRPHHLDHHLHCSTSGQISSLFCLSDKISELCRKAWIFCSNTLDILVTAKDQRPNHHVHFSTSGQISFLFISLINFLNLNLNFAGLLEYFTAHHWQPNLKPKSSSAGPSQHCVAGWGWCCWWADSWSWLWRVGWSWPAAAESPSKPPAPALRPGTDKGAA